MRTTDSALNWQHWLERWDAQQTGYLPDREARFTAMFDVIARLVSEPFTALDLGCGPGALSRRLLDRFPGARCIALDVDPVLLQLGQGALGNYGGRLEWVDADLRTTDWRTHLGNEHIQVVLSTTALHWLTESQLAQLYHNLGKLLPTDGLFLNGDHLRYSPQLPTFQALANQRYAQVLAASFPDGAGEDWQTWWNALRAVPELADLFHERDRRFPDANHDKTAPILDLHLSALHDAGFHEIGIVWQQYDDRVLLAIR